MNTTKDPNEMTFGELVRYEKAKRDRNWDPRQRWNALQEMIGWAESQTTVRRNTREACLREQAKKLAQFQGET